MANSQRPLVNQRLYYCRLHLQWLTAELDKQSLPKAVLEQALGGSTLVHLVLAYRAYLQEIAEAYNVPLSSFQSVTDLNAMLVLQNTGCAEANELVELEQRGWLKELLLQYQAINELRPPQHLGASSVQPIMVTQVANESSSSLSDCSRFYTQLSELIDNQRTRLEEW